jgi:hypothetical protein
MLCLQELTHVSDTFLKMFPPDNFTVLRREEFITIIRKKQRTILEHHDCCLIVTTESGLTIMNTHLKHDGSHYDAFKKILQHHNAASTIIAGDLNEAPACERITTNPQNYQETPVRDMLASCGYHTTPAKHYTWQRHNAGEQKCAGWIMSTAPIQCVTFDYQTPC